MAGAAGGRLVEHLGGAVGDVLPAAGPQVVLAGAEVDDDVGCRRRAVDDGGIVGEQRQHPPGQAALGARDVDPRRRGR